MWDLVPPSGEKMDDSTGSGKVFKGPILSSNPAKIFNLYWWEIRISIRGYVEISLPFLGHRRKVMDDILAQTEGTTIRNVLKKWLLGKVWNAVRVLLTQSCSALTMQQRGVSAERLRGAERSPLTCSSEPPGPLQDPVPHPHQASGTPPAASGTTHPDKTSNLRSLNRFLLWGREVTGHLSVTHQPP